MVRVEELPIDTKPDQSCLVCVSRRATAIVLVPVDLFDIPGAHSRPREAGQTKWIPVCKPCIEFLAEPVFCSTCSQQLESIDAVENSSGTCALCRPCSRHEEDGMGAPPRCIYCGEPMPHNMQQADGPVHGTCPCPFCGTIGGHKMDCRKMK